MSQTKTRIIGMIKLRTVKQLKKLLEFFNDDCELGIIVNGLKSQINDYSWSDDSSDSSACTVSVKQSMYRATELNFYPNKESENER